MRSMKQQNATFRVPLIVCACTFTSAVFLSLPVQHVDSNTTTGHMLLIDDTSQDKVLQDFAVTSSNPNCGLNCFALTGQPNFGAYYVIYYAREFREVSVAIDLREDQSDRHKEFCEYLRPDLEEPFAVVDESKDDPELYSFLDTTQRHAAELIGLRLDGCTALLRSYWIERLDLEPSQIDAMQQRATDIRKDRVAFRIRRSFAGIAREPERFLMWEATTNSVSFNLWVISLLSEQQKAKLAEYLAESTKYDSALRRMFESWLGMVRRNDDSD